MKKWVKVAIPVFVLAVFVAWYIFRPERLVVNRSVAEAMPSALGGSSPQPVVTGQFYSILHPTAGTATIYQMGDGTRVLRFTNFKTSNGPDVHVYMVAADDAKDIAMVQQAGFVDLGVIKVTSATRTTRSLVTWTWRNTAQCRYGANDSV
jgi:hypothetical protein